MPGKEKREELLSTPSFSDILTLVTYYNDKKRKSKDTQPLEELQEIELAIKESLLPSIRCTNPLSLEQGIALVGCQNKNIIELFIQQLFTEIENNQNHFPELYSALAACIGKEANTVVSDTDKIQISQAISERIDTLHAPDIALSCYMVHTLYAVLHKMVEAEKKPLYNKQIEKIEHALKSLSNRLQVIKLKDVDEEVLLAHINEAIKFSNHVLNKLEDDSSLDTKRCLYKIKIAGLLLLQALAVEAEWYGVVVSMGVSAPTALGATYSFMSHILKRGKQAYYCFSDNKEYLTTLIKWQESLETYLVASKFEEAKAFLEKLKENKTPPKYWDNPYFILGAIKILLVTYEHYPEIQNTIISLLIDYYDNYQPKKDVLSEQIVKQVSFTLLKLLEAPSFSAYLLKSQLEAIKNNMSEEEKALYVSYQQSKEASKRNSQYNLAMEVWKQRYEGDVKLYEICLLVSEKGSADLTKEQLDYIGTLNSQISASQLSNWGEALLSTFNSDELNSVAKHARLKAFITQNIIGTEVGLSKEDIGIAAGDKAKEDFVLKIINLVIEKSSKTFKEMNLSEEQTIYLRTNFDHFIETVFKATPQTTTELTYYNDVIGCRIMKQNNEILRRKEAIRRSTMTESYRNLQKENRLNSSAPISGSDSSKTPMEVYQTINKANVMFNLYIEKFIGDPVKSLSDFEQFSEDLKQNKNSMRMCGKPTFQSANLFIQRYLEKPELAKVIDNKNGLEILGKAINSKQKGIIKQAIIGNGGVGKSWLAEHYFGLARKKAIENQNTYNLTIWTNETTLFKTLFELAQWTGCKVAENSALQVWITDFYRRLLAIPNIKILLVIDDIRAPFLQISQLTHNQIFEFLPDNQLANSHSLLHIVITSRWREWKKQDFETLPLSIFSQDEAIIYLQNLLPLKQQSEEIRLAIYKKLADQMKYLPFALRLVASYIKSFKKDEKETAEKFISQYDKFYKQDLFIYGDEQNDIQNHTIANLWSMTLKELEQSKKLDAIKALCCLSYLEGSYIDKSIFAKLLNIASPPDGIDVHHYYIIKLRNYLDPLYNYSLIEEIAEPILLENKDNNKTGLQVHALLQESVRFWQENMTEDSAEAAAHLSLLKKIDVANKIGTQWKTIIDKLHQVLELSITLENFTALFPHLSFLLSNTFAGISDDYEETKQAIVVSFNTKTSELYVRTLAEHHAKRAENTVIYIKNPSSNSSTQTLTDETEKNQSMNEIHNKLLRISALRAGVSGLSFRVNKGIAATNTKIFQLPEQQYFVGRQEQLHILHTNLSKRNACVITQAIQGFGGTGKTRLAIQYTHQYKDKYDYIIWFDTEANLMSQIRTLLKELENDELSDNLTLSQLMQKLYQRTKYKLPAENKTVTKEYATCLFIFDNVDNPYILQGCLPPDSYEACCHIIITSRQQIYHNMHTISLQGFSKEEGFEYIRKHLGDQDEALMLKLLECTIYLPLALAHAVAYIQQGHSSLEKYPEYFNKHQLESFKSGDGTLDTVRTSVTLSLEGLQKNQPHALRVLQACVGLAPDNISPVLLEYFFQSFDKSLSILENDLIDKLDVRIIDILSSYSLIEKKEGIGEYIRFSIHRLVLEVMKDILDKQQKLSEQLKQWAKIFIEILSYDDRDSERLILAKLVALHAQTCLSQMSDESLLKTELLYQIGYHYEYAIAEPTIARTCFEQVLNISQSEENKAIILNHLGNAYGDGGNRIKKRELLEEALEFQIKKYGENHPFVAITMINLANSYGGTIDEEEEKCKLLKKALKIQENTLGRDHWQTAGTMDNLAMAYCMLGSLIKDEAFANKYLRKAKKLWEKALILKNEYYGDHHFSTAITIGNYGCYNYVKKDFHTALEKWNKSLKIKEEWYGENHWMIIPDLFNIANAYGMLKNNKKQRKLLKRVLAIQKKSDQTGYLETKKILEQFKDRRKTDNTVNFLGRITTSISASLGHTEILTAASPVNLLIDVEHFKTAKMLSSNSKTNIEIRHKGINKDLLDRDYSYDKKTINSLIELQLGNNIANIMASPCIQISNETNFIYSLKSLKKFIVEGLSENRPSLIPVKIIFYTGESIYTFSYSYKRSYVHWIGILFLPISQQRYRIVFINAHGNGANRDIEISKFNSSLLRKEINNLCTQESHQYWIHVIKLKEIIEEEYNALNDSPDFAMFVSGFSQLNKKDENDTGAYLVQNFIDLNHSDYRANDFSSDDSLHHYDENELKLKHRNILNQNNIKHNNQISLTNENISSARLASKQNSPVFTSSENLMTIISSSLKIEEPLVSYKQINDNNGECFQVYINYCVMSDNIAEKVRQLVETEISKKKCNLNVISNDTAGKTYIQQINFSADDDAKTLCDIINNFIQVELEIQNPTKNTLAFS